MIGDRHDENGFAARVDLARTAPFSLGGMQVVPASRTVAVEGRKLVLEPRVMQVLVVLAQAAGEVVSRDELISRCWAGAVVGDDSINRVIFRLRRLAEETKSFRIETVARVGYRLEPLVATQAGGSGQPSSPTLVSALNPARSSWRSRFVWATCLVGAAGAGAVAYWLTAHDPPVTPVIAVLPFTDRSPNGAQKYLAEGVAEDVLTLLSGDSGLRVIGESSVKQLQTLGRATGPDARRLLAATHIVEGAVASDGARLRVTVRLIETQEGEPLWAEEFDGKPAEVFRIQEQIASAVSRRVQGTFAALKSKEFRRLSTSPEVYRLYVTAKGVLRRRDYRSLLLAEHSLRQALYLDDQYAPAHALMAITVDLLDQVRPSGMEQNRAADRDRARAFALRSIELAPDLAEGHAALGMVTEDPKQALAALERAKALDPGNFFAWNLSGLALEQLCRMREALPNYQRAALIEPLLSTGHHNLVETYLDMGRDEEAGEALNRFLAVRPDPVEAHRMRAFFNFHRGDIARTIEHARMGLRLAPDSPWLRTWLAYALRAAGDTPGAVRALPTAQAAVVGAYWRGEFAASAEAAWRGRQTFWDSLFTAPIAVKAMYRAGRTRELLQLVTSRWASIEGLANRPGCDLDRYAPTLVLALRAEGANAQADRLLEAALGQLKRRMRGGDVDVENDVSSAALLMLKGDHESALSELERAVSRGWLNQQDPLFASLGDPVFDPIRGHRRFRLLANRITSSIAAPASAAAQ